MEYNDNDFIKIDIEQDLYIIKDCIIKIEDLYL
jgi:hypothetical protein